MPHANWAITATDTRPFKKYLSIKSGKGYLHRLMLSEELKDMPFDKTLSRKIKGFLQKNDPKMIFIYGENDPWDGCRSYLAQREKEYSRIHSAGRQPSGTHLHTARKGERRSDEAAKRMVAVNAPVLSQHPVSAA